MVSMRTESLFSLAGKTVVLTGASGFLGRTFARALLANEARLIALGRSQRLDDLATTWSTEFGPERVRCVRVDMYDLDALSAVLDDIGATEDVDALINNAYELSPETGFNTPDGTIESAGFDQWTKHFTSGLYWPALAVQKLGPGMKSRGHGSIVNIATMYAVVAPDPNLYAGTNFLNPPGYSAAKAAMVAFTRYVASFWGEHGIRSNAILPGPFSNTEDVAANTVDPNDPFLGRLAARTALGRPGRPDELVGALLFLTSDASSYVTGHALVVDGGWTIR
jgi:NAD(P)-dependent dehydrogenase (short-subunit alcohol dehydrogenase family)